MRRPLARLLAALSPRAAEAPVPPQPQPEAAAQTELDIIEALPDLTKLCAVARGGRRRLL